jgi:hypothetical protein
MFNKKYKNRIIELESINKTLESDIVHIQNKFDQVNSELEKKKNFSMADLMRDMLHLPMLDFSDVDAKGHPPHPLLSGTKEQQLQKQTRLAEVHRNDVFQEVMAYWINRFGNHALRKVDPSGLETKAGIFSINGITAIRKELERANMAVREGREPPEDFDENGVLSE